MTAVIISDSHNQHQKLILPRGDIIIHCGDVSGRGSSAEVYAFVNWFDKLDFKYKIFIAGNHDFFFEKANQEQINNLLDGRSIVYLNDSGVSIEGINIWGSPVQPWFYNWAFNRKRGEEIKKHWDLIPNDTNVLITHGPPKGILDLTTRGDECGCEDLFSAIKRIKPKYHLFGHIHEAAGIAGGSDSVDTIFINASVLNENYKLVNEPIVVQI